MGVAGAKAPEYVDFPLPEIEGVNYTLAVTLAITAVRPDGTTVTWSTEDDPPTVELRDRTTATCVARHVYAEDESDVPLLRPVAGKSHYRFRFALTVDGVPRRLFTACDEYIDPDRC